MLDKIGMITWHEQKNVCARVCLRHKSMVLWPTWNISSSCYKKRIENVSLFTSIWYTCLISEEFKNPDRTGHVSCAAGMMKFSIWSPAVILSHDFSFMYKSVNDVCVNRVCAHRHTLSSSPERSPPQTADRWDEESGESQLWGDGSPNTDRIMR